ncbi:hypothetical protein [Aeromonas veronii]|uniref:hypothetical protein n=1 Tax=Aeromonas veronii TaxID=654 RepID=UPI001318993E|nr:hypothetical protein [Aeromonas veronii]MBM0416274.1 hypothetical protein [Aeromonas veronii]MBW3788875.1 hypothetical protein [Aeromonas veronii]QHC08917.1 hypothetical protein GRF56_16680 [Aeromonas veronii]
MTKSAAKAVNSYDLIELFESTIPSDGALARRKPVHGVGINDAMFVAQIVIDGQRVCHPAYRAWVGVLRRSLSQKMKKVNQTYSDVHVCAEWTVFTNFLSWWRKNHTRDWHLDKDLLKPGNKIYGPDACVYVPQWLNLLTVDHRAGRGKWPLGVHFNSGKQMFRAELTARGKRKHLGYFDNPQSAYDAYRNAKLEHVYSLKAEIDDVDTRLFERIVEIVESSERGVA